MAHREGAMAEYGQLPARTVHIPRIASLPRPALAALPFPTLAPLMPGDTCSRRAQVPPFDLCFLARPFVCPSSQRKTGGNVIA